MKNLQAPIQLTYALFIISKSDPKRARSTLNSQAFQQLCEPIYTKKSLSGFLRVIFYLYLEEL